jgi:hypothetical protein
MDKFDVNVIIEILGRPPENITQALQNLAAKIAGEKGIKIKSKTIHDPIPAEGTKDLFTSFMELSLEMDSLQTYLTFVFSYMPSNIELVKPSSLALSNTDLNEVANNITRRLHHYDAIAKQMLAEKDILIKQLYQHAPHLFKRQENQPQQTQPQTSAKKTSKAKPKKSTKSKKSKK